MTNYSLIFKDIKEILETVPRLNKVSIGGHIQIDQEDTFAAAYIIPGADSFDNVRTGTGVSSYDNSAFVRVIVNESCEESPYQWGETRDAIIQAVLKDNQIWTNIVDRDIVGIIYDDMNVYPKMTMELLFEFKLREVCT